MWKNDARQERKTMWQERAGKLICFGASAVGLWLLFRYALGALMPFLIAALLACLLSPLAGWLSQHCRIPRKLCAFLVVIVSLLLFGMTVSAILSRFLREAEAFLTGLGAKADLQDLWQRLLSCLPERMRRWLSDDVAEQLFERVMAQIGELLATTVGVLLRAAPTALLNGVVTVLATFYLTVDGKQLLARLYAFLPCKAEEKMGRFQRHAKGMLGRYLRAICLLFLLTFLEVLVGLALLGRRYALLCALGVAAVDILPVFGSGTVLIPWALLSFARGEPSVGLGLLILYGTVTVIRQILEPHLIGGSLGLHPFWSLFGMVLGLRLFGVIGMLLAPIGLSLFRIFLQKEEKEKAGSNKKTLDRKREL